MEILDFIPLIAEAILEPALRSETVGKIVGLAVMALFLYGFVKVLFFGWKGRSVMGILSLFMILALITSISKMIFVDTGGRIGAMLDGKPQSEREFIEHDIDYLLQTKKRFSSIVNSMPLDRQFDIDTSTEIGRINDLIDSEIRYKKSLLKKIDYTKTQAYVSEHFEALKAKSRMVVRQVNDFAKQYQMY